MDRPLGPDLELLADSTRVRVLALLEAEELTVGELARALATPQPTISRHLKHLSQEEWVTRRSVGPTAFVRMAPPGEQRLALWSLVKADPSRQRELEQDRERMALVLAERNDGRTFFGRVADGWDLLRDQLFGRRFLPPALAALLPRDQALVDLGCGTGELLSQLAPAIDRLTGVDREPSMLEIARRRLADHPHVAFVEAALEEVPLEDASADLATIILVLHHLPDPHAVLGEARRILKRTGRLVVVDMQPHDHTTWRSLGHLHQGFSSDDLTQLASSRGLTLDRYQPLPADPDVQGPPLFLATLTPSRLRSR
jgi:SAM-dependent methyltransferase